MKIQLMIVALVLTVSSSFQAFAGETLSADQVKSLIAGKTIHGKHLKKGFNFSAYFAKDGSMIRKWKKETYKMENIFLKIIYIVLM